jgi:hypothetical protein
MRHPADHRLRTVAGLLTLAGALVLFLVEPLHGPVLFALAGSHGLDLGDVVVAPLLVLALWLLRDTAVHVGVLQTLERAWRRGLDPLRIGLVTAGIGLILVQLFREIDVSGTVPHAGVAPAALAAAGLVILIVALMEPGSAPAAFGAPLVVVVGVLGIGLLIDATNGPEGSVVGPTLLAALFTVTLGRRRVVARYTMGILTVLLLLVDLSALVDERVLVDFRESDGGGLVRTGALGLVLLLVAAIYQPKPRRPDTGNGSGVDRS